MKMLELVNLIGKIELSGIELEWEYRKHFKALRIFALDYDKKKELEEELQKQHKAQLTIYDKEIL